MKVFQLKKFIKFIPHVHKKRYSVVINKIAVEKIPMAYLSVEPIQNK